MILNKKTKMPTHNQKTNNKWRNYSQHIIEKKADLINMQRALKNQYEKDK